MRDCSEMSIALDVECHECALLHLPENWRLEGGSRREQMLCLHLHNIQFGT